MSNNEKVVLITGASRGIGAATALEFASKGYKVAINYLANKERALGLQKEISVNYGVKTIIVQADISDEEQVKEMIQTVIDEFGKIDVLVNNAGIALDNEFDDKTVEEFRKVLNVNLIGTYLVSKYASRFMIKEKKGKIINIASTNGIDTYYSSSIDYDASKAGVISLTHNLSKELSPYINVNAVAPGWVNTEAAVDLSPLFRQEEVNKIYFKRFAEPSEIAKVIVFLASDDASYINNTVIRVDGGY